MDTNCFCFLSIACFLIPLKFDSHIYQFAKIVCLKKNYYNHKIQQPFHNNHLYQMVCSISHCYSSLLEIFFFLGYHRYCAFGSSIIFFHFFLFFCPLEESLSSFVFFMVCLVITFSPIALTATRIYVTIKSINLGTDIFLTCRLRIFTAYWIAHHWFPWKLKFSKFKMQFLAASPPSPSKLDICLITVLHITTIFSGA